MDEWWYKMEIKLVVEGIQRQANVYCLIVKCSGIRMTSSLWKRVISGTDNKRFDLKPE